MLRDIIRDIVELGSIIKILEETKIIYPADRCQDAAWFVIFEFMTTSSNGLSQSLVSYGPRKRCHKQ